MRDISGNEIALYNGNALKQWNIGKDGKIDADKKKYFFLKDHLGTVRAVMDTAYNVVEANDVDMWGYRMMDREYTSSVTDNDYLFTGKERDSEKSGYDYFGARYLDSRVGRWGGVEPLLNKYVKFSPYSYSLNCPLVLKDPMGMWIAQYNSTDNTVTVVAEDGDNLQGLYNQLGISADDFASMYNINDINSFSVVKGETSFDITNFVLTNSSFDAEYTNSNCHGFVCFATGETNIEEIVDGELIFNFLGDKTSDPKTGDIGIFRLTDDLIFKDENGNDVIVKSKGFAAHSAIFVIKNQSGTPQFLNRVNTNQSVTMMLIKEMIQYQNAIKEQYESLYSQYPDFPENPEYYKRKK